jgi:DNA polymerase III subunit alpha, Gram-positive type
MNNKHYIVLDIETTWLSKYKHQITEIAAIRFDGENILDRFHTLINPQRNIPSGITRLTGITNEMVSNAPVISEIIPDFLNFIKDDIIVAHNSSFDMWFLSENIYKHKWFWIENNCLCTRKLTSRLIPELPKKNLGSICEHMWLINKNAHRAMSDTIVTVEVFRNLLTLLKTKWTNNQIEILEFQNRKICDCI